MLGFTWFSLGKTMGKGEIIGKSLENHKKTMGKGWENRRKMMISPLEIADLMVFP